MRQLFLRLGAGDNGSITYQMLEEQMNSDAAPCFEQAFCCEMVLGSKSLKLLINDIKHVFFHGFFHGFFLRICVLFRLKEGM